MKLKDRAMEERLREILANPVESLVVDFKSGFKWTLSKKSEAKKASLSLIKHIIAMANTRGGWLIIGVHQKEDRKFVLEGVSAEDCSTWDTTPLCDGLNERVSPSIDASVSIVTIDSLNFVVVEVPAFPREPHIVGGRIICNRTRVITRAFSPVKKAGAA